MALRSLGFLSLCSDSRGSMVMRLLIDSVQSTEKEQQFQWLEDRKTGNVITNRDCFSSSVMGTAHNPQRIYVELASLR